MLSNTDMVSKHESWARFRRQLWRPPRAHGQQPQERVVGPLELFYDLIVVVLVAQAAHQLAGHLNWHGLGQFAAVFALVWIAWLNGTLHHELHGFDDARGRSTFLLQILVLAPLGAFIPKAGGEDGGAFAVNAGVLFGVLAILWMLAGRGSPAEFRVPSRMYVTGTAVCAVALVGSAFLPADDRVPAWGALAVAYLVGLVAVVAALPPSQEAALTVTDALAERFGLLFIIVLGETVQGVVAGLAGEPTSVLGIAVGLVAVVVGFGAWWTYFDFAAHRSPRGTRPATVQWILLHLPLTAAVTAMAAGMVTLVEHAHDDRTPSATAWALCGGVVIVLSTTMVIAASLQVGERDRRLFRPLSRISVAVSLVAVVLGAARPAPLLLALVLVLLLAIPWGFAVAHRLAQEESPTP